MSDTREFGPLAHISAEAIGQPGQRRFRLRALSEEGDSASLWLEKEQLVALGEAIENVLKQEGYTYRRLPSMTPSRRRSSRCPRKSTSSSRSSRWA
jgi:hypothetical protein